MLELNQIKKLIFPLIKGLPLIIGLAFAGYWFADKSVSYIEPKYESTVKIKLDGANDGVRNTIVYKDFDLYPTSNKIATEVEVIKSEALLSKVVKRIDLNEEWVRIGNVRNSTLCRNDLPFNYSYKLKTDSLKNTPLNVVVNDFEAININYELEGNVISEKINAGEKFSNDHLEITLSVNPEWIADKDSSMLYGNYSIHFVSEVQWIERIKEGMHVMSVSKDVPVLRVSYKDVLAERAAMIANTIAEMYIEDYVSGKSQNARKTSNFIDNRINEVALKLKQAENNLEAFKKQNQIKNLKQETETGIKKIAELEVQLANLEMNEAALDQLSDYVSDADFENFALAPQVGFGDLLFTELMKKLKLLQGEKAELSLKYTDEHELMQAINEEIAQTSAYVMESVQNAKQDISTKRASIQSRVDQEHNRFNVLPELEKQQVVLEREFIQYQKTYNDLKSKQTEASIAAVSGLSFHRILQKATISKDQVSPNETLMKAIAIFLGACIGIVLSYLFYFIFRKVNDRFDIEKNSSIPVLGILPKAKKTSTASQNAVANICLKITKLIKEEPLMVSLSSFGKKEGKSFLTMALAERLEQMGYNVLLIDADIISQSISNKNITQFAFPCISNEAFNYPSSNVLMHRKLNEWVKELSIGYDIVLFDTASLEIAPETVHLMQQCQANLMLCSKGKTSLKTFQFADAFVQANNILNPVWILNRERKYKNVEGTHMVWARRKNRGKFNASTKQEWSAQAATLSNAEF